jgi:hypothetical protein
MKTASHAFFLLGATLLPLIASEPPSEADLILDGASVEGQFRAEGDSHGYRLLAPPGRRVRLTLDLADYQPGALAGRSGLAPGRPGAGLQGFRGIDATEVYIREGAWPSPTEFDFASPEVLAADSSIDFTVAGDAPYYVLVLVRCLRGIDRNFTLSAQSLALSVAGAWPAAVGNAGEVTLRIDGSDLGPPTSFRLEPVAGSARSALRLHRVDSGRVWATFDLRGAGVGPADLVAERGGTTVRAAAVVSVIEGGVAEIYGRLGVPAVIRRGRAVACRVTYGNRGLVDAPLPLIQLEVPNARGIAGYGDDWAWGRQVVLLGLGPEALLPSLGPQQEVTRTFWVLPGESSPVELALSFTPGEIAAVDTRSFEWGTLPCPAGTDPAVWRGYQEELRARLGATLGEFYGILGRELADLAAAGLPLAAAANVNGQWLVSAGPDGYMVPYPDPGATGQLGGAGGVSRRAGLAGPGPRPADGVRRVYFVVVSDADYTARDPSGRMDLAGKEVDHAAIRQWVENELRVPAKQTAFILDRRNSDADTLKPADITDVIRSFRGQIDADDELVFWYSGHGSSNHEMVLNGGVLDAFDLEDAVLAVRPGTLYLVNESCYADGFNAIFRPEGIPVVAFAATTGSTRAHENPRTGGQMNQRFLKYLREGKTYDAASGLAIIELELKYGDSPDAKDRQKPVLRNASGVNLKTRPWRDASGEQQLAAIRADPAKRRLYEARIRQVASRDPNDKVGPAGEGEWGALAAGETVAYEIHFENQASADAPAREVVVTDGLDPALDWATFELERIAFNDVDLFIPPDRQRYGAVATVGTDAYPVAVAADFDPAQGVVTWSLRSFDPLTGELPEDPLAGFLPPNDPAHRGEGTLRFRIRVRSDAAHDTLIGNQAEIVFDPTDGEQPPIDTPWTTNRIDRMPPTSRVIGPVGDVPSVFRVQWGGEDGERGAGVVGFDVFVATSGGPWTLWRENTTETEAWFAGAVGNRYDFHSVASDRVGNREPAPAAADISVRVTFLTPRIRSVALEAGQLRLDLDDLTAGIRYAIEEWDGTAGAVWASVETFVPAASHQTRILTQPPVHSQRFFRLKAGVE